VASPVPSMPTRSQIATSSCGVCPEWLPCPPQTWMPSSPDKGVSYGTADSRRVRRLLKTVRLRTTSVSAGQEAWGMMIRVRKTRYRETAVLIRVTWSPERKRSVQSVDQRTRRRTPARETAHAWTGGRDRGYRACHCPGRPRARSSGPQGRRSPGLLSALDRLRRAVTETTVDGP
jgi:hypothetical protein